MTADMPDTPAFSHRLLSLLSLIEESLFEGGASAGVSRSADYRKGIARMTFDDGRGGIVLHNFLLADGQLCVRVELRREGAAKPAETAIYPTAPGFEWKTAAARVAREWRAMETAAVAPEAATA